VRHPRKIKEDGEKERKMAEHYVEQLAAARERIVADRRELADEMTNARGWTIFAGFIVSWLLLATVVVISAKYWT
jgi:hypothetical protein